MREHCPAALHRLGLCDIAVNIDGKEKIVSPMLFSIRAW